MCHFVISRQVYSIYSVAPVDTLSQTFPDSPESSFQCESTVHTGKLNTSSANQHALFCTAWQQFCHTTLHDTKCAMDGFLQRNTSHGLPDHVTNMQNTTSTSPATTSSSFCTFTGQREVQGNKKENNHERHRSTHEGY